MLFVTCYDLFYHSLQAQKLILERFPAKIIELNNILEVSASVCGRRVVWSHFFSC